MAAHSTRYAQTQSSSDSEDDRPPPSERYTRDRSNDSLVQEERASERSESNEHGQSRVQRYYQNNTRSGRSKRQGEQRYEKREETITEKILAACLEMVKASTSHINSMSRSQGGACLTSASEPGSGGQPLPVQSIGPCVPSDGGKELQINDWLFWKRKFIANMKVLKIEDPLLQQDFFTMTAGDKLLMALTSAPTAAGAPEKGFDQTVKRLDSVFLSQSSEFNLIQNIRGLTQTAGETNVRFLNRLKIAALRIHPEESPELDREITYCVSANAYGRKLKEFAMLPNQGPPKSEKTYENLIEYATTLDWLDKSSTKKKLSVNAIDSVLTPEPKRERAQSPKRERHQGRKNENKYDNRESYKARRSATEAPSKQFQPCKHCGGKNHSARDCKFSEAKCYGCNKVGHIRAACKYLPPGGTRGEEDSSYKRPRERSQLESPERASKKVTERNYLREENN